MRNFQKLSLLSLFALTLSPMTATAADIDFDLSANAGFVSEYSFLGIAQSDEHPAVQGGFDVAHSSGLYAGVWGSNVDFNDGDEASPENISTGVIHVSSPACLKVSNAI